MLQPRWSSCWFIALALAAAGCRPGDAPKEPTEPTEPTVGRVPDIVPLGGMPIAIARRSQGLARLH
jgi:hypothetical protein